MKITETHKAIVAAFGFIAAGLFTRWAHGPAVLAWFMIGFGAIGLAAVLYGLVRPLRVATGAGDGERVALRDGHDYRVDLTDAGFVVAHKTSSEARSMDWREVTFVGVMAIDGFPAGRISFVLHRTTSDLIEVPWDAEGSQAFLKAMREKLDGFDNRGVIEAASMLHGFKQLWPAQSNDAGATAAPAASS